MRPLEPLGSQGRMDVKTPWGPCGTARTIAVTGYTVSGLDCPAYLGS